MILGLAYIMHEKQVSLKCTIEFSYFFILDSYVDRECAPIAQLLQIQEVFNAFIGPRDSGKTTILIELYHRMLENGKAAVFIDLAAFTDLNEIDLSLLTMHKC